jgi:two-component system sensor histidine kinase/response regulator
MHVLIQIIFNINSFRYCLPPGMVQLSLNIISISAAIALLALFILFLLNSARKNRELKEKNQLLQQMNVQLKLSEIKLKKLNETKSRLFSIIAHDLRSSMNAILGFSEIIAAKQKTLSESELNKYSNIINQSANKVHLMMENLLDWSRAQGETIRFNPENFDLNSTAYNVTTLLEIKAYQKNVEFISLLPKGSMVHGDKIMVASILRNLLDNALKFTPSGGKIEVSALKVNGMIEVRVKDTGIGMDPEVLENLFVGESHTSTDGTNNEKGTGLGLYICRDFVEMHGGKLWAESTKGIGTVFKFSIPAGTV